jgi:acetylornithine/N-succinyldiaminopimelate aminotransferase
MCAAALAVVTTVLAVDFQAATRHATERLGAELEKLGAEFGASRRGRGLLQALVLEIPIAQALVLEARNRGLLLNAPRPNVLRFMPELRVSDAHISEMGQILSEVWRETKPGAS